MISPLWESRKDGTRNSHRPFIQIHEFSHFAPFPLSSPLHFRKGKKLWSHRPKSGDLTLIQYNHLTHCTYSHFINRPPGSFHSLLPPRTHTYPHASFPCLFSFFNPKQFLIFLSSPWPWPWPFWEGKGSYFQKCLHLCLFVLSQDEIQAVFSQPCTGRCCVLTVRHGMSRPGTDLWSPG